MFSPLLIYTRGSHAPRFLAGVSDAINLRVSCHVSCFMHQRQTRTLCARQDPDQHSSVFRRFFSRILSFIQREYTSYIYIYQCVTVPYRQTLRYPLRVHKKVEPVEGILPRTSDAPSLVPSRRRVKLTPNTCVSLPKKRAIHHNKLYYTARLFFIKKHIQIREYSRVLIR